jgi:hypothetical protein
VLWERNRACDDVHKRRRIRAECAHLRFVVALQARLLVLKIHSELDYAGAEILDRVTISGKWNGACAEKGIDCSSAWMVKEVKELCD